MKSITGNKVTQKEMDDAGSTIINFGSFKKNPMTLADIVAKNDERDISFLIFVASQMPIIKGCFENTEIKDKIRIYLLSRGLYED